MTPPSPVPSGTESPSSSRSWPHPELHGPERALSRASTLLLIGGLTLALPLLFGMRDPDPFLFGGGFGTAWWVLLVTTGVGAMVLLAGYLTLVRTAWRAGKEARRRRAAPAAPGEGRWPPMDDVTHSLLVQGRKVASILALFGSLWLSVAFGAGLLLAGRGALDGPGTLALWVLAPAGTLLAIAALIGLAEGLLQRVAAGTAPARTDRPGGALDPAAPPEAPSDPPQLKTGWAGMRFRILAWGAALAIPLALIPPLLATGLFAVGSFMTATATPRFDAGLTRMALAESVRDFRLPPDPSLTAEAAGDHLHALTMAGGDVRDPLGWFRPPLREHPPLFWAEFRGVNPIGAPPPTWGNSLFLASPQGLDPEAMNTLRRIARHSALEEFRMLARASDVSTLGQALQTPFPVGATIFQVPIPGMSNLRNAAYAQVADAALLLWEGDRPAAELRIREVISVGFLLMDGGTTMLDHLMGGILVTIGSEAMEGFLGAVGREEELNHLRARRAAVQRAVNRMEVGPHLSGPAALSLMASDTAYPRGVRWEASKYVALLAPCYNLRQVVFGPGESGRLWLEARREELVRHPGDAPLFDLAMGMGETRRPESRMAEALQTFRGERPGEGSCLEQLGYLL